MANGPAGDGRPSGGVLARRYPPLFAITGLIVVLALLMPSSLRVPQQDPTPVLEYAPVPPTDENAPNTSGNASSLSLGSSNTLEEGNLAPPPAQARGKDPRDKDCTGKPARQTEDPMSPPCVPFFDGDNGGQTWLGVTEDEIRVLIYLDEGCPNYECSPDGDTYWDLDNPPKPQCPKTWPATNPNRNDCDYVWIRVARALMTYFNDRFQTYNRRVHYFAYISNSSTPADRRADAADNYDRIKPFAVIDYATYQGNNEAYARAMASRGVMMFTSRQILPNSYYRAFPPYSWGFWPDIEHWSRMYSSYVCEKVWGHPVRRMGNPPGQDAQVGGARRLGLWYTSDDSELPLQLFATYVKQQLRRCGANWVAEADYAFSGFGVNAGDDGKDAREAVARFKDADVTTVLYLGGTEGLFSKTAAGEGYYPEIVIAGDLENDNNNFARIQEQTVWQNVWGVQLQIRMDGPAQTIGASAYREGSPNGPSEDWRFANEAYRDHFMLFQAIQVAGPRLSPKTIDEGFHAIPPKESVNPYIASCFFEPGDWTCVKDAQQIWWDPDGTSPGDAQPGCWRVSRKGQRYLAGRWPDGDDAFASDDPCTGYDSRTQIDPNTNP